MAEQTFIPGTEPKKDRKIHKLAIEYLNSRDSLKLAKQVHDERSAALLSAMKAAKRPFYYYDGLLVELVEKESVKAEFKRTKEVEKSA